MRFCANDTGNEGQDLNFGETICVTDGALAEGLAKTATPEVQNLVIGTSDFCRSSKARRPSHSRARAQQLRTAAIAVPARIH